MQKEKCVSDRPKKIENPNEEINELYSDQNKHNPLLSSGKSVTEIQMTRADDTQVSNSHSCPDQNPLSAKTENMADDLQDVDGLDETKRDSTIQYNEGSTVLSTPKKDVGSLPPHGHNPYYSEEEDSVISMQNQTVPSALSKKESLQAIQIHAGEPQILGFEQIPKTPKKVDKALEDGYNWRKYGQKLVKCNEFVRNYYRCTYLNCSMKRQVERAHDGPITDIVYRGQHHHHHPKPHESSEVSIGSVLPIQQKKPDEPSLASGNGNEVIEAKKPTSHNEQLDIPIASSNSATEGRVSQSFKTSHEDGDQKVKKRKIDAGNTTSLDKTSGESRIVVQAQSEVDMVNDGYRWRKYGQKMVKGNPNPRSYYRCTNVCCPVKKHVERDSADPKIVITTYEGQHNHDIPLGRIVSPNSAGSSVSRASVNDHSSPRPKENKPSLDIVVHISAST